ncbi:MAG: phosphatase PAP2 family protein [Granulosicoccus sp.]
MHVVARSITPASQAKLHLISIAALALMFATLCLYALFVDSYTRWDLTIIHWSQLHRGAVTDQALLAITMMADLPVSTALVLGLVLMLLIQRYWWLSFYLTCTFFSTTLSVTIIKHLSQRARPALPDSVLSLMSFPSGHAARAVLVFGLLALFFSHGRTRQTRTIALLIAVTLSTSVAASRVFLGVHWVSDVLAGAVLAALMLTCVDWQLRRHLADAVTLPVNRVLVVGITVFPVYYYLNLTAQSRIYALAIQN